MEVTCPTAGRSEPPASQDQEMLEQEQQGSNSPQQPGPSLTDRESHDLETQGYTILSLTQLCNTAEAAKAKRKAYKSERQKKAEKRNAFHTRNNKDCIIQAKSFEIQDLCARLNGIQQKHKEEMERVTKVKDMRIAAQGEKIRQANMLIQECEDLMEEGKRVHAVELESRDVMQALLLVDLRELTKVYDEEIEVLKRMVDRQALPPDHSSINNLTPALSLRDTGSATPEHIIATALSNLRKALAAPLDPSKHPVNIANTLHNSLLTIKQGFTTKLCPLPNTSLSLHAVHECVDRVIHFLCLHPNLHAHLSSLPVPIPPFPFANSSKNAKALFRRAFCCADTLALELCSLHFSSGGRRASLLLPNNALPLPSSSNSRMTMEEENNQIDKKDDLLELQYWKRKFEGARREAMEWKEDVGVTVFGDVGVWLEGEIVRLV